MDERPNLYCTLNSDLSRAQIAELYRKSGFHVRKCDQDEYEVRGPWCQLVIEAASPILMHGIVLDVVARAADVLAPLGSAAVSFTAECYGQDGELLKEFRR